MRCDQRTGPLTYQKLPVSRRELAERGLTATDPRNPHPTSLNARISMIGNVGRGTSPELALRAALRAAGLRGYRIDRRIEGVRPDIVFGPSRVAVFVHGCFWHRHMGGCRRATLPKSRLDYWLPKFAANKRRDRSVAAKLRARGWRVLVIWECELKDTDRVRGRIARFMSNT